MGGCVVVKTLVVRNNVNKGHLARNMVANQQCCVSMMFQRLACVLWVAIEKTNRKFQIFKHSFLSLRLLNQKAI